MIASRAIVTTTEKGWRKISLPEAQDTLHVAFTEWGGPLEVQTDHEVVYITLEPFHHLQCFAVNDGKRPNHVFSELGA